MKAARPGFRAKPRGGLRLREIDLTYDMGIVARVHSQGITMDAVRLKVFWQPG